VRVQVGFVVVVVVCNLFSDYRRIFCDLRLDVVVGFVVAVVVVVLRLDVGMEVVGVIVVVVVVL